jgi:hypothetical protein
MSFNPYDQTTGHDHHQSGMLPSIALEDAMDSEATHSYGNPTHVGDNAYVPIEARGTPQPSSATGIQQPTVVPITEAGPSGHAPIDIGAAIAAVANNPEAMEQLRLLTLGRPSIPLDPRNRFENQQQRRRSWPGTTSKHRCWQSRPFPGPG